MDVGQVRGLAAERRTVVHDLELDLLAGVVDDRHGLAWVAAGSGWIGKRKRGSL